MPFSQVQCDVLYFEILFSNFNSLLFLPIYNNFENLILLIHIFLSIVLSLCVVVVCLPWQEET